MNVKNASCPVRNTLLLLWDNKTPYALSSSSVKEAFSKLYTSITYHEVVVIQSIANESTSIDIIKIRDALSTYVTKHKVEVTKV